LYKAVELYFTFFNEKPTEEIDKFVTEINQLPFLRKWPLEGMFFFGNLPPKSLISTTNNRNSGI